MFNIHLYSLHIVVSKYIKNQIIPIANNDSKRCKSKINNNNYNLIHYKNKNITIIKYVKPRLIRLLNTIFYVGFK